MSRERKILIIDDEPNMRKALRRLIREKYPNAAIVEAEKAEEIIHRVRDEAPNLILLDILMPGMNGLQVLQLLKKNENAKIRNIPVIILTGIGNREIPAKAKALGAADCVTKPFDEEILFLKLKKYLK